MPDPGPDFLPPGAPLPDQQRPPQMGWQAPPPAPPPLPPDTPYVHVPPGRSAARSAIYSVIAIVLALTLMSIMSLLVARDRDRRANGVRTPVAGMPQVYPDAPQMWQHTAADLRPDVSGADINNTPDGDFDEHEVIDAGSTWVLLTDDGHDHSVQAIALGATTGTIRWRHPLGDAGMCASALLGGLLVCLHPTATDSASGLGTRWMVEELRPDTGVVVRHDEAAGWFCAVHVSGERIILVEQQRPAPHAAVSALDAALHPAWHIDLRSDRNHGLLFSTDRIVQRHSNYPAGPALDRLRVRDLRPDLLAVWAGAGTVFLNPVTGRLAGFPHCSRLQFDGSHVWCNEPDHAVAYALNGGRLVQSFRTPKDVRLAYVGSSQQRNLPPVFVNDRGVVGIDPATGRRAGVGFTLQPISAMGMSLEPDFAQVGDLTLAVSGGSGSGSSQTTAFDARTLAIRWTHDDFQAEGGLQWHGRTLVLTGGALVTIDPASGAARDGVRIEHSSSSPTLAVGDALVDAGTDGLARLRL